MKTLRQAQRSNALITYVRSTGALYYNQNKSGGGFGTGGQFAALESGVALTSRHFALQS
ncbi:MAG: hypothetical protein HC895_22310 [Leptolyngbyaceae cyanobacterium SM1_3_5]|nr:hypothetical protein [Leptolyngbyaceae cyanobacterium SM1_3_5]